LKIFVLGALIVFVGISAVLWHEYSQTTTTLAQVRSLDDETHARYSEALSSISTIQDSLNSIVLGPEAVRLTPSSYQNERGLTQSQGDEIMDRIAVLKAGIERSKERLQQLDENLRKSGVRIDGLEKMMASLRRTVAKKEAQIVELTAQVASLNTQVSGLNETVASKDRELGTVYCMIGSKKDLTSAGAVKATGGVLGMGKTLKPTGMVDESRCIEIDTATETTVDIPSPKAQVISEQPIASYTLEKDGDHTVLRILDPTEFRKIRHLVIMKKSA
jgi:uncharacterized coiled-coil protein SlyX